jgi:phosphoribosylaminoimidazolecarboxamide formyltransferase / IMP cyclohydrolase
MIGSSIFDSFLLHYLSHMSSSPLLTDWPDTTRIERALLSCYDKTGLIPFAQQLVAQGVTLYASGGTATALQAAQLPVIEVSELTGFVEILDGRVKTLHPAVFGGILARRDLPQHQQQLADLNLPLFDLVVVDLYPFEAALKANGTVGQAIELIDVGGVALIRAAAKNHAFVTVIPAARYIPYFLTGYQSGEIAFTHRAHLAAAAFALTSSYDQAIGNYVASLADGSLANDALTDASQVAHQQPVIQSLRYGENPHQSARFLGDLKQMFSQLHGQPLSYNNLIDVDSALRFIREFQDTTQGFTCGILKHNTPCAAATRPTMLQTWQDCLACDPVSAFGGVIVFNGEVDEATAAAVVQLFYEVILAPAFSEAALTVLQKNAKRIILQYSPNLPFSPVVRRSLLNGAIEQDDNLHITTPSNYQVVTERQPSPKQWPDLAFGEKVVKHLKSNAIALVRNQQMIGSGTGQTSRVAAFEQAVSKARQQGFDPAGAVLVSDGFFPFSDIVAQAAPLGLTAILQPGGSIRDNESIAACNTHGLAMIFTGYRHFRH